MNIGFNYQKEIAEQTESDITFGAKKITGIADNIGGIVTAVYAWPRTINGVYQRVNYTLNHAIDMISEASKKYLPIGTVQRGREDWMNCASNSPANELEKQHNYAIKNKLFSQELIEWFQIMNYINPENGLFEISDAFISIGSGTGPNGNSLKAPLEFVRSKSDGSGNGIIPKIMLPDSPTMTFNQYHNPKRITKEMWVVGQEYMKRVQMNYQKTSQRDFAAILNNLKWEIFDSYVDPVDGDFIKRLAENYKFMNYGYRIKLNEIPQPIIENPNSDMITLIREVGTEPNRPVYAIVGGKKDWQVSWEVVKRYAEIYGYKDLKDAQDSIKEISKSALDGYPDGGVNGNISIIDFMKIMFGGEKKTN